MSPLAETLHASYFDGKTPQRHAVELRLDGTELIVRGAFGEFRAPLSTLTISEPMGQAPRFLRLADGRSIEVMPSATLTQWLASAGKDDAKVVRAHAHWHWALAALAATVMVVAALYVWALPALSHALARLVPDAIVESLSEQTLTLLDERLLAPSTLPVRRQQALTERAAQLLLSAPAAPAYRLHFRAAPTLGPVAGANAFALPNGDVVVLDALVALAQDDEEITAVIAHELGHVAHRHGLRQMIQSSMVAVIVGTYLGDVSSLATGLATLSLQARYSRAFEFEADDYARERLRAAGRDPGALARLLERLASTAHESPEGGILNDALSTHPDTAERVRRLKGEGA